MWQVPFSPFFWTFFVKLTILFGDYEYVRTGLNSHYFHIIGDGHQPTSRGLYTHYKDSY